MLDKSKYLNQLLVLFKVKSMRIKNIIMLITSSGSLLWEAIIYQGVVFFILYLVVPHIFKWKLNLMYVTGVNECFHYCIAN